MVSATTYPNLKVDEYVKSDLLVPPVDEQERIVDYLDEQTAIIDSTITKEEKRIELLKEFRQSLISEVVTGKVKVA
jgi:type I restriction enzyme S subunit